MQLYMSAQGDCVVCRKDATGSPYWVGMSPENWEVLRPFVGTMCNLHNSKKLKPEDKAQNVFFVGEGICQPLCSPECSMRYHNVRQAEISN